MAHLLAGFLNSKVEVTRSPIQNYGAKVPQIQIGVERGVGVTYFIYPTYSELETWAALDTVNRTAWVYRLAERFKTVDERISDNLETIKSNLDALI